jgi:hypothetical protein
VLGGKTNGLRPGGRVGWNIGPAVRAIVGHVEDRVLVDVEVPANADAHVKQVLHGATLPGGAAELLDVVGHQILEPYHTVPHEHPAQRGIYRLRDRHQQMRVRCSHPIEVALTQNRPVMDDEKPIGVGLLEHRREIHRPPLVLELKALEITFGAGEGEYRAVAPSNPRRPSEFGDMAKPQPVEGTVEPVRARQPHPLGLILISIDVHLASPSGTPIPAKTPTPRPLPAPP